MKSDNYVVIQGWMCNELELKGNELLVFALIYGFSQDEVSKFSGSRSYIANTFNISLPTVDKALHGLLDKEYIKKHISGDYTNPDTYWVNFEVIKKLYMGDKETLSGGSKETLPNKTNKQITSKKEKSNSKELLQNSEFTFGTKHKPKKENLYSKCVALVNDFTVNIELNNILIDYLQLRLEMKDKPLYVNSWKGLLNKLTEFDAKDRVAIVKQSIERGYAGFFPVNSNYGTQKNKPWEEGVHSTPITKEELDEIRKRAEEREANGQRGIF